MLSINFSDVKSWAKTTRPNLSKELNSRSWRNAFISVYIHDVLGYTFQEIENLNIEVIEKSEG